VCAILIVQAMNTASFHSRLGILGLSIRRIAAMTALGRNAAWSPTGVPALGAVDAGNYGPVGITETAQ
jgi:hypothetical protein